MSFAAIAGPPGPPTPAPVNVNVVNPALSVNVGNQPLSVAVQPTLTPISQFYSQGTALSFGGGSDEMKLRVPTDVVLTGVRWEVQLTPAASSGPVSYCSLSLGVIPNGASYVIGFTNAMADIGNGISSGYIPLPNVHVVADSHLHIRVNSPAPVGLPAPTCYVTYNWYGIKAD